jgi:NAD(P)-dependent dehydrogenase (short-subunit alcohol dehydrogenase family)
MSERLKGKIGIVTGAGSGIGRACAIALASEGARVALVGRRKDRVEEVAHKIGDSAFAIPADVSKTSEVSRLMDETVIHFGRLDFLE